MNTVAQPSRQTRRRRLMDRLLPPTRHGYSTSPGMEFVDSIVSNTDIHFGWRDRLRVVLTGQANVRVVTHCQYAPGNVESDSSVSTA